MKKIYGFLTLVLLISLSNSSFAQCISTTPCFTDGFGYVYHFGNVQVTGVNVYTAEGTCSAYSPSSASIKLDLTNGISSGTVKIVVRNGAPDGCTVATDSFIYVGTAQLVKGSNNIVTSFSGSGSWTSYCFGGVLNSGTWFASGPCGGTGSVMKQATGTAPADGKQKVSGLIKSVIASPNPTNSATTISYGVQAAGKVNLTVYNSMEQPVKVLVNEAKVVGNYSVQWNLLNTNGTKVTAGVYRAVLTSSAGTLSSNIQVLGN